MFKVRMKPGKKHHRREGNSRVVKYHEDGPFDVSEREYSTIRDRVERLDLPHQAIEVDDTKNQKDDTKNQDSDNTQDSDASHKVVDDSQEKEKEKNLELKFAGEGMWNIYNKITKKNINDIPLSLDEAKALI